TSSDAAVPNPLSSPTLTMRDTQMGTILGTAAYMSPEQARGQTVDKRADIWALGLVLYEMLTGRPLFSGLTVSDSLAGVLKAELDLTPVPLSVRPVVEHCLRRDPQRRWRDIGDVRVALEDGVQPTTAAPMTPERWSARPWIAATAVLVISAIAGGWF